nr:MAG TPA: hypothetical protein [Bacteriophage sp.]
MVIKRLYFLLDLCIFAIIFLLCIKYGFRMLQEGSEEKDE